MFDQLDIMDKQGVAEVTAAIRENRIQIAVQGVHPIGSTDELLYGECFARLVDGDGAIYNAGEFVPVLDIWGETPLLDRHIIQLVLDRLETNPNSVLGCNISGDSLVNDADWFQLKGELAEGSHLANRLVLEFTESCPLDKLISANERLGELRQLGCRIAIDNFGRGYVTPYQLLNLPADIVKIDGLFVQNIRTCKGAGNSLAHMIALAKCAGASVVVAQGVETGTHLIDATMAGATHAQGFGLSRPAILHGNAQEIQT